MAAKKKDQQKVEDENFNFIVRIVNSDIDGQKTTVIGLQSIKGVGKRVAQIVAKRANVDTFATFVAYLSIEQRSFFNFRIGNYHMESLTGTELGR
jgi:small subunit ribosomal protein S13